MWLPALLLASALLGPAPALGHTQQLFGDHHGYHNHPHPAHAGPRGTVFPFLTWLRDSAVELIFRRPRGATASADDDAFDYAGSPIPYARYANEIVLRFNVTTEDEERALAEAAERLFLDVWAFTTEFVDIRIHKDDISSLVSLLPKGLGKAHSTLIPDLSAAVWGTYPSEASRKRGARPLDSMDNIFFQDYQPLPVVLRWMRLLESLFPSIAQMTTIGKSYEGRDIFALKVGALPPPPPDGDEGAPGGDEEPKRRQTLVVTGGAHAREWISTSTVNYLAWAFITAYGKEPIITQLLDHVDVVFVPALNPDGVEYTWRVDRLWRKSRQHTSLRFCRGLDLDRAFGYEWDTASSSTEGEGAGGGGGGSSSSTRRTDPCSESYGGDEPFQAVEALELAEWARNQTEQHGARFVGLIDLHSYSQQILYPYSYSCAVDPPNLENLEELAAGIAKAVRLSSGEVYGVDSACEGAVATARGGRAPRDPSSSSSPSSSSRRLRIEPSGGAAIDWFYHEMGARFSYRVKLRDTGSYGFLLPPDNIVPTGEEMFQAMKYLGDYLLGNNGIERQAGAAGAAATPAGDEGAEAPPPRPDGFVEVPRPPRAEAGDGDGDDDDDDEVDADEDADGWAELRRRRRLRRR